MHKVRLYNEKATLTWETRASKKWVGEGTKDKAKNAIEAEYKW